MSRREDILLSGFTDEIPEDKDLRVQLAVAAALGLRYVAVRFLNLGDGIKNILDLTGDEVRTVAGRISDAGLQVSSLGSPLGKVKLQDVDDGTRLRFIPFPEYLATDVQKACAWAHILGTTLVRGFSFYPPRGSDPRDHIAQAVDQLSQVANVFTEHELTLGIEVEAHLVGCNGQLLAEIHRRLQLPNVRLVFDPANLVMQGYATNEVLSQYRLVRPAIGWMHIKDLRPTEKGTQLDEDRVAGFVPAGRGDGGLAEIFADLKVATDLSTQAPQTPGMSGFLLELEPHLRRGGQFGGMSGPEGFGMALRACCQLLDSVGLRYRLAEWES